MIDQANFRQEAQKVIDWVDNYFAQLRTLPVKSQVKPREIYEQIPDAPPKQGESIDVILADLDNIILPGITHWQHPNFHAYFPGNSSVESLLGEIVTAAIGAQCMVWETSPAAAELEQRMMEWLRDETTIPATWQGVIQDSASSATLTAMITAREVATGFSSNFSGVPNTLRIYCSEQAHSSVEKAVGICGIGRNNLRKIAVDEELRMIPEALLQAIKTDKAAGLVPCMVVAAIGTTGTVSVDPLEPIAQICKEENVWLHIDAAYAGTALLLPEYRWMIKGIELADSIVFNPHKWMFTAFDCSAYFVKDSTLLIKTFDILPEYLKTSTRGQVNDYRDWGIPLGRRFRALKLWFVMRGMGMDAIRQRLREQIGLAEYFAAQLIALGNFTILRKPFLGFVSFQYANNNANNNDSTEQLLNAINKSGKAYLSHTKIGDQYAIRFHASQTYTQQKDIDKLLNLTVNELKQLPTDSTRSSTILHHPSNSCGNAAGEQGE